MKNFYQIIFASALICLLCLPNQALCQDETWCKPTGVIKGLWAEDIIMHYDSEYCEDRRLIKEMRGHLKIVDDKGYPNIWFPGWCS